MKQVEHNEQVLLMQWWALSHNSFGVPECLLFAIPNGGHRHISVARAMKAEGVRAGVPDMFLAISRGGYFGLFIELKKPKGGRVSKSQSLLLKGLAAQGYKTCLCCGWVEARAAIESYLKSQPQTELKLTPETP